MFTRTPDIPRILVTGFEPFAGADDNPSARLIASLANSRLAAGIEVVAEVLPVSTDRMPARLRGLLKDLRPNVVIGFGEARGSSLVRVERLAVNLLDFHTPDNDGRQLHDAPIVPGGPAAYLTTLPAADVVAAVRAADVPCDASLSAGAYLCNQMMYLTLHWAAGRARAPRFGFVHVPSLPSQITSIDGGACMDLTVQRRALDAVLQLVARRLLLERGATT